MGLFSCGGLFFFLNVDADRSTETASVRVTATASESASAPALVPPALSSGEVINSLPTTDAATQKDGLIAEFSPKGQPVRALVFSPDNKFLFVATQDSIQVFDLEKKSQVGEVQDVDEDVCINTLAVTPDGLKLISCGRIKYLGRIEIWSIEKNGSLSSRGRYIGHASEVNSIAISPDSKFVLTGDKRNQAIMWEIEKLRMVMMTWGSSEVEVCFAPDGIQAFVSDGENLIRIDVPRRQELERWMYGSSGKDGLVFSDDAKRIAYLEGKDLKIFATKNSALICDLPGRLGASEAKWVMAFHPDGNHLFTGSDKLKIWDIENRTILQEVELDKIESIESIDISRDGSTFAISANGGSIVRIYKSPIPAIKVK
jgi:WD40 repeat protein